MRAVREPTALPDVVAPAEVVVGPAGVFVVLLKEHGGRGDLRAGVRTVRAALDAAGLSALPVEGILSRPGFDDLGALAVRMTTDLRFGPRLIDRAIATLAPFSAAPAPPWVATVAASGPEPDLDPAVARPAGRRPVARDRR